MARRPSLRNAILIAVAFILVLGAVAAFAAMRLGLVRPPWARRAAPPPSTMVQPPGTLYSALELATSWANGAAPARADLRGHPVLVVVWSDTYPEGLAALARAEEVRDAYQAHGIRVIGIQEPDFSFAADTAIVAHAARRAGARFPIALDPAGRIAASLGVHDLRSASLVADTSGALGPTRPGARGVVRSEGEVRAAIAALNPRVKFPADAAAPVEDDDLAATHAIYLGVGRAEAGPIATARTGRAQPFTAQFRFEVEGKSYVPYPVGWWTPGADGLTSAHGGAATYVALRYESGALDAVISPPPASEGGEGHARVWILSDERWLPSESLGEDARLDARGASYIEIDEPRLYHIARGGGAHEIKLSPDAPGVTFHALLVEPEGAPHLP